MAANEGSMDASPAAPRAARDMAENGQEWYGWRIVDGERRLVVVGIGFTVVAQPAEEFEAFKQRMISLAAQLGALQYPVRSMTLHRRAAQRKAPWCIFECETPEAGLPGG